MDPISSLSALYKIRKISLKLLWGLNEIKYLITIQFLRYSSHFTYKSIHSYKLQFFSAIIIRTPKLSSVTQSCLTLCDPIGCQTFLSTTNSQSLPKLTSIVLVILSNHLILCRPLLLPLSIFTSIRVFSNESVLCIRWPKYWSFSFSISPSNEYSGLISFRMNWLDLLAVQGTLKSLLQHHSSKASILQHSAFFIVQL